MELVKSNDTYVSVNRKRKKEGRFLSRHNISGKSSSCTLESSYSYDTDNKEQSTHINNNEAALPSVSNKRKNSWLKKRVSLLSNIVSPQLTEAVDESQPIESKLDEPESYNEGDSDEITTFTEQEENKLLPPSSADVHSRKANFISDDVRSDDQQLGRVNSESSAHDEKEVLENYSTVLHDNSSKFDEFLNSSNDAVSIVSSSLLPEAPNDAEDSLDDRKKDQSKRTEKVVSGVSNIKSSRKNSHFISHQLNLNAKRHSRIRNTADFTNKEIGEKFPNGYMRVYVFTLNLMGLTIQPTTDDICRILSLGEGKERHDMYIFGTQESPKSMKHWDILVQSALGFEYVMLLGESFECLHVAVFIRRDLIFLASDAIYQNVGTRRFTKIKTKGTFALSFAVCHTSFLLLVSHFTAGEGKKHRRVRDHDKTLQELNIHQPGKYDPKSLLDFKSQFDRIFWLGDFNSKIEGDPDWIRDQAIAAKSSSKARERLLSKDEIIQSQNNDSMFVDFLEGRHSFPPTYKFDVVNDSSVSVLKKTTYTCNRVPAYSDRIFFKSLDENRIRCRDYGWIPEISLSDHKPVYASYHVHLVENSPDRVDINVGKFRSDVYIAAKQQILEKADKQGVHISDHGASSTVREFTESSANYSDADGHPNAKQDSVSKSGVCVIL